MQKIGNPFPLFLDSDGLLLNGGYIYLGIKDGNPLVEPVVAYWDSALTQVADQPLRTIAGLIVNGTAPAQVFIAQDDYSQLVQDVNHAQVTYSPSVYADQNFQPLNDNLTAIAALATTAYGRALLTLANQPALQAAVGYSPFTGGTVTSNIVRQGAGTHWYWVDDGQSSGRVFQTASGAADPTSLPGDVWIEHV